MHARQLGPPVGHSPRDGKGGDVVACDQDMEQPEPGLEYVLLDVDIDEGTALAHQPGHWP